MFEWDPDFQAQGLRCEETHVSKVYLGPHDAWKIKKPVDFGFLDYSTPEKRYAACEAEVVLNRRFSPSVYLGVVPLIKLPSGRFAFGGKGEIAEWAVHMARQPESDRADRLLAAGRLGYPALKGLAERLAAFHAGHPAPAAAAAFGSPSAVGRNLEENFIQTRPFLAALLGRLPAAELEDRMTARLRSSAPFIEARFRGNRVCDGHGDLRLGQIYFDPSGECRILDCIEFNDRFRYGDPACDIAFLSMDLAFHGHPEMAEGFLAAYAAASGDFDLYPVIDFYQAYRACVRGKVAGFLAAQMEPGTEREARETEARAYFHFALAERMRPAPAVIAVGGGMGSGKTTLAGRLGELLCAPVVSTDPLRKRMAGIAPLEKRADALWHGLYAPETTEKVYAETARLSRIIGDSGRSVIIDASFRSRAAREAVREAAIGAGRPFLFIECRAGVETCRERLRRRASLPNPSDGNEGAFEDFLASWEPADEIPSGERLLLETEGPPGESADRAMRACLWMRARSGPAIPA